MLLRDLREQLQAAGSVPLVELAQRNDCRWSSC